MTSAFDAILNQYFGYNQLKPEQTDIITHLVGGGDVCAVLPTGFGKSICYQLPHVITEKTVIVISPLLALIADQIDQLQQRHIPAAALTGTTTTEQKKIILQELVSCPKIIYTTPEYITKNTSLVQTLVDADQLCCVAIDESHCVSNWGHDFRPDYSLLSCIKEISTLIPILAVTATATKQVRDDICDILRLANPLVITSDFNRPNLYIAISERTPDVLDTQMKDLLTRFRNDKKLIYCTTKADTDKVAAYVTKLGFPCEAYNAGKDMCVRTLCQTRFTQGDLKCITATTAFGMGVNIPDIRLVIHYNSPGDMESYYQEIGRTGRDGKRSECHLFYGKRDFVLKRVFLNTLTNEAHKKYRSHEIENMENYVTTKKCRRKVLLDHFESKFKLDNCGMCDICCNDVANVLYDCTEITKPIISLISFRGLGTSTYVKILKGSGEEKIKKIGYEHHGIYKHVDKIILTKCIDHLVSENYASKHTIQGGMQAYGYYLKCTAKCNDAKIMLPYDYTKYITAKNNDSDDDSEKKEKKKTKKAENPKQNNDSDDDMKKKAAKAKSVPANITLSETIVTTYNMIRDGMSTQDIAIKRDLVPSTIENHIITLISHKLLSPVKHGMTTEIFFAIKDVIDDNADKPLKEIKGQLGDISYFHIKMVIAMCQTAKWAANINYMTFARTYVPDGEN